MISKKKISKRQSCIKCQKFVVIYLQDRAISNMAVIRWPPPITIKSVMLIHPFSILHQVNLRSTQLTYHICL